MTGRTGAEVAELDELRRVFGRRADDLAEEAASVGAAIDRFLSRSEAFVPSLPPHRVRGAALARRLDDLGFRVERSRDGLAAADRWVGTSALWFGYTAESARQAGVTGWATGPGTWARMRRWHLDRTTPERLTTRQVRARVPGGLPRAEAVRRRDQLNATNRARRQAWDASWDAAKDWSGDVPTGLWDDTVADVRRLAGRGPGAAGRAGARLQDATSVIGRGWGWVSDSRIGAVGRLGGSVVAVGGVVVGGVDFANGYQEGDTEQMVTGGLAAVSAGAMLIPCPPVQVAGAIVTGGLLVYEYRDEIAGAVRTHIDRQVRYARQTVELAGDVASTTGRVASGTAAAVGDMADSAWDAVKGLF